MRYQGPYAYGEGKVGYGNIKALIMRVSRVALSIGRFRAGQERIPSRRRVCAQNIPAVMAVPALLSVPQTAWAQGAAPVPGVVEYFSITHIATFLTLMLGPFKIIGPFVSMTRGADKKSERKIALLSVLFSTIALLLAGLLGEILLSKYGIPLPILALSGGIILFVVALSDNTRTAKSEPFGESRAEPDTPSVRLALTPLAFPTIVPPYGIAALIVFLAFTPDMTDRIVIGLIVLIIMLVNLLAMIFSRSLITILGTGLSIVGAVLGVVQVALGLQIIHNSLLALRVAW